MQAFISGLDEECWSIIEKVEVLKPREKWTAAKKKASS